MKQIGTQRGLSVLEVMVAITLFLVIAAGLASTTVGSIRANATSRDLTAAAALVHDKMEQFRALDPAANPADLAAGSHNDPLNPVNALGQAGGIFNRSWAVVANSPTLGVSQVTVTVTWRDPAPRTLVGVTYVCRTTTCP